MIIVHISRVSSEIRTSSYFASEVQISRKFIFRADIYIYLTKSFGVEAPVGEQGKQQQQQAAIKVHYLMHEHHALLAFYQSDELNKEQLLVLSFNILFRLVAFLGATIIKYFIIFTRQTGCVNYKIVLVSTRVTIINLFQTFYSTNQLLIISTKVTKLEGHVAKWYHNPKPKNIIICDKILNGPRIKFYYLFSLVISVQKHIWQYIKRLLFSNIHFH